MPHRPSCKAFLAAAVLVAATTAGGCSPASRDGRPVIGVSLMNLSSEFIVMLEKSMRQRAEELGVTLIVNDAQRSPERQVQQIENFIAQGVDAIVLNPCEVEASAPAVEKARAAGIPIVNVNSETKSPPTAFVGSRDEESARLAVEYIARRLGGKGNLVMLQGYLGQAAQLKRDAGAREVLAKHPDLRLLAEQTANWDRDTAMARMANWLESYGDRIDAVFAQNDEMAMGALLTLERAKKKDKVIVVGVDAIADAVQAVADGRLDATVFQDAEAQGRQAIDTALRIVRNEAFDEATYIPFRLIAKENAER